MLRQAPPPPTAVRAVGALVRAAEACAAAIAPATAVTVDAHLLVASTGDLARVEARSDAAGGEAIVRCLTGTVVGPPRGRVTRLDLRLVVGPAGKVTVAR